MNNVLKKIVALAFLNIVLITILGIGILYDDIRNAREIIDVDYLSGQRIGVISGAEADYYLNDREDINLKRYNSNADLFLALSYRQVDAIAIDDGLYNQSVLSISNLKIIDDPIDYFEYTYYTSKKHTTILDEMNEFIKMYKKTDEYQEFEKKYFDLDWIDSDDYTEPTGTGEELKVGYITDFYPSVFKASNDKPRGPEIEFLVRFANQYNKKLVFAEETESKYSNDLKYGIIDICACKCADVYRDELNKSVPFAGMTEGFMTAKINCVGVDGKMKIKNDDLFDK